MNKILLVILLLATVVQAQLKDSAVYDTTMENHAPPKQSISVKFVVSPPEATAALSGNHIGITQWQGEKVFRDIPSGKYILRLRMEKCKPLDTNIILSGNNDIQIDIRVSENGYDFKSKSIQKNEIRESSHLSGKEWIYSLFAPGIGQVLQERPVVGVFIFVVESVLVGYYYSCLLKYNPARSDYESAVNKYKYTPLTSEREFVLKQRANAANYYNKASIALACVGAGYLLNALDAYFFQPGPYIDNVQIYPGVNHENESTTFTVGVRVRL